VNRQVIRDCHPVAMNHPKVGAKLRIARLRLGLRQSDIAVAAGFSRQTVSRAESGRLGSLTIDAFDRLADVLGVWPSLDVRSPNSDLDRMLNARHAALAEQVMAWLAAQPGWAAASEISFSFGRETGIIDILAYHLATRQLAVLELKTGIYDVNEMLGTLDRKERLAAQIARARGWAPLAVSVWLIVADSSTNRRRVAAHRSMIASKLPTAGRSFRGWFKNPVNPIHGVAFWSNDLVAGAKQELAARERVRRPTGPAPVDPPRSPGPAASDPQVVDRPGRARGRR
jgi:transcriptional regulator with XRE-family HTH domain